MQIKPILTTLVVSLLGAWIYNKFLAARLG
jgi:hypothetical protein